MYFLRLSLLISLLSCSLFAQSYFVRGRVSQKETGLPLGFANIRVEGTTTGTSANMFGKYELKLNPGDHKLIISFIGYISDTVIIKLDRNIDSVNFSLESTKLDLPEIVVLPGENPALEIIRKAIARKKERNAALNSYEFTAYTKGLIRTKDEIGSAGSGGINISISDDSTDLKITGILESQSQGYFEKPDKYKEIILARKQTSNFPPSVNTLTGGRLIKNFYDEDIDFLGRELPGPISDNALDYYYFYIEKTLALDSITVYQVHIEPDNSSDPGFSGSLFITDKTYDLIKTDLQLNRAANTGGIFDTVNVIQQFSSFGNSLYMPVDYRMVVSGNVLGIFKFGFELNSILYNYKINPAIDDDFFDKVVLQVVPDADKKDSTYWMSAQTIPTTESEDSAYTRIDSIKSVPRTFWDDFSILSTRIKWSDYFYTSAPLAMYHYNRIEGHALDFGLFISDAFEQRLNSSLKFTYGFADKKLKKDFLGEYLLGDYRTTRIMVNAFDRLNFLFGTPDKYEDFTNTLLALLSKFEFRDYYYSKGVTTKISSEIFPVLELSAGFMNRTDNNAFVNTEFAVFGKEKTFRENPQINETRINAVTAGFRLDFRDIIEDGIFRRRVSRNNSYIIFEGDVTFSNQDFLKSSLNFTKYELYAYGRLNTFRNAGLNFRIFSQFNDGTLPYQMLHALPGNINWISELYSFRTLGVNEVIGENVITANLEHNWGDEIFRFLNIPGLKNWELQLTTYINAAFSDVNNSTRINSPAEFKTFRNPFYEAGFLIGHVLLPIQLDFAWKLNHRGENNFRFAINSLLF